MKLLVVADLDFGLGEHFLCTEPNIFFLSSSCNKKAPPFCMQCTPYGHWCTPPLCETQSIWSEAFASLNIHNHSFIAVKRSFPVPASVFFAVDLSF